MSKLYLHPLFLLGLVIRLIFIYTIEPLSVINWYAPFMVSSIEHFTVDPWSVWLTQGGSLSAFPYGVVMWVFFLPLTLVGSFIGVDPVYSYSLTLLVADLLLLKLLNTMIPGRIKLTLFAYWLSPIVILASYGLGLNDLIPVFLLTLALFFIRKLKIKSAGVVCIAAISAKLSMVLALPFFLLYLFNRRSLRQLMPQFLSGLLIGSVIFGTIFLLSDAGLQMLLSNPEMGKIYNFSVNIGNNKQIYLIPLLYLVMLYMVWRVKGLNFDLFYATLGLVFLMVVLMTPASPGWFIWTVPILVVYQAMSGKIAIILTSFFSAIYVLSSLIETPLNFIKSGPFNIIEILNITVINSNHVVSLLHTIMVAAGIILAIRILRETVAQNDYFRLTRKAFVIGIAGDSSSGKSTLSNAIKGLFGGHSVVTLSGDDYHLWDHQKPIWQVMTHLNPRSNDIEGFANDLISLKDGKSIQSRHYEHKTGRMSRPHKIKSNDIIITHGLHALYLPIIRDCCNLSVYLDIDEKLRRHFKIKRDVNERGNKLEKVMTLLKRRESDSKLFIHPQKAHADLILSVQPIHPHLLDGLDEKHQLRYKLVIGSRHGFNEASLTRVLVGICGLHVDMSSNTAEGDMELTVEGEVSAEDISLAAKIICPRIFEFLDISPDWQGGIIGLMQLVTLSHINQSLRKRII